MKQMPVSWIIQLLCAQAFRQSSSALFFNLTSLLPFGSPSPDGLLGSPSLTTSSS